MSRTLIRGGLVVDGTGSAGFPADVLIEGDRIEALLRRPERGTPTPPPIADAEVLDATGCVVAPGIVDEHTHSDISILSAPDALSSVCQGITTQLVGLCGFSGGPWDDASRADAIAYDPIHGFPDVTLDWTGFAGYLDAVREARPATNIQALVGHTTVRRLVVGAEARPATAEELRRMGDIVRDALAEGAAGFSSGLSYPVASSAAPDELAALARVAAKAGKPYHTHMRSQGTLVLDSLEEALTAARTSGVRLIVSHLYPAFRSAWGLSARIIERLDAAQRQGMDVAFDLTILRRGGGALAQSVPIWATAGGLEAFRARTDDPVTRRRLADELRTGGTPPGYAALEWDDQVICRAIREAAVPWVGRTIGDIARERGADPVETAIDLLREDIAIWIAPTIKDQGDLDRLLSDPRCVPMSDGFSADPVRHAPLGILPKSFATFPHWLGSYVRDRGVIGLEDAVRRMTAVPAARMGLTDRGRLLPGLRADVFVFDPATIAPRATEIDPVALPVGVRGTMVNGAWAWRDGAATGARTGMVL